MSAARYARVAGTDDDTPTQTPTSPPPSFRSRTSSPVSRTDVNQTLTDTFDADSDDENGDEDDDRQRLMRGSDNVPASAPIRPIQGERRVTLLPSFAATSEVPVPTASGGGRVYGGGSGSDGVFANLSAKPETGEKVEEHPPTYEQAAADAAPPYWETTILAPGLGGPDEVYIDGLPVGSIFSFAWNAMISIAFQPLIGFILTYLLHTTHAARNGSRAGLGVTIVQYGFYIKSSAALNPGTPEHSNEPPPDPNAHDFDPNNVKGSDNSGVAGAEWLAYALMIVGWFILIRSLNDFYKARKHEQLVLQSPERGLNVAIIAEGEGSETVV